MNRQEAVRAALFRVSLALKKLHRAETEGAQFGRNRGLVKGEARGVIVAIR